MAQDFENAPPPPMGGALDPSLLPQTQDAPVPPPAAEAPPPVSAPPVQYANPAPFLTGPVSIGGILEIKSAQQMIDEQKAQAEMENNAPIVQGLASHIRKCWEEARRAKENTVEPRMFKSLRQRRGEYDPDLRAQLERQGSAMIYMMLTSNKCRSAVSWLREALGGMPWECEPTPVADIDIKTQAQIMQTAEAEAMKSAQMGYVPSVAELQGYMIAMKNVAMAQIQEIAKQKAEKMTKKMKDQMIEGGFPQAFDEFLDDLVTFPAACFKGPVVRSRPQLKWKQGVNGENIVDVEETYHLEWDRVDPFNLYPAPDATNVDDGYLIERHKLSRQDLNALKGVEGYSEASINAVLADYGMNGLRNPYTVDSQREQIEGKDSTALGNNPSKLIDALQFWGSVPGQLLIDWGMDDLTVDDPLAEYHIEAWLVGQYVIKATINPDPLHRKPYYKTSWENVPGCFWGHSVPDLCRDTQAMCNAAARALCNNMSLASGPQVMINSSRLPAGEEITSMYPWKIWSYTDDGYGTPGAQPIGFFQPNSNSQELMQIYQSFSLLADEYTGIPRYMTGDSATGGAGRTASGLSMLMGNAGKSIKNVIASVDRVVEPAIERLYIYNMQYLDDQDLKGDVKIVARGANAIIQKEQQQQRVNEVFQMVLTSPILQQIVGPTGIAYLFRNIVERLSINPNEIVPPPEVLKVQQVQQQQAMAAQQAQLAAAQQQAQGQPEAGGDAAKPENKSGGRRLMDGTPQLGNAADTAPK